jgi:hypothetical protein
VGTSFGSGSRRPTLIASVLTAVLLSAGCGGSGGKVIAEGDIVAEFTLDDGRYVITKVEAYEAGKLKRFPMCDGCPGTSSQRPVVVIWLNLPESRGALVPSELAIECGTRYPSRATVYVLTQTRAEARCDYYASKGEEGQAAIGFQPNTGTLPTRISLVTPGNLPIRIGQS